MDEVVKIVNDIKSGNIKPIYFLMGEEPYYIDKLSDFIEENVLAEDEKGFNQTVLYGRDVTIEDIIGTAKRYPMMAERQVVIVKEAQDLSKTIDKLESYAENPMLSTVLVICCNPNVELKANFASPYFPFFVVTRITPFPARDPYIAPAAASLRKVTFSIDLGFNKANSVELTIIPSMTNNGSLPALIEPYPLILSMGKDPGDPDPLSEITPEICPANASAILLIGSSIICSDLIREIDVVSFFWLLVP